MATVFDLDKIWQTAAFYLSQKPKNKQIRPQEAHGTKGDSVWIKAFQDVSSEAAVVTAAAARDEVNASSQRGLEMI